MSTNKTIIAAGCLLMGGMLIAMSEKDGTLVPVTAETSSAIFRISEVEVHPEYVDSYLPFASEVAVPRYDRLSLVFQILKGRQVT